MLKSTQLPADSEPCRSPHRRLCLSAETVRTLTSRELRLVVAGACDTASAHSRQPPGETTC
jgi:hypothetical protein